MEPATLMFFSLTAARRSTFSIYKIRGTTYHVPVIPVTHVLEYAGLPTKEQVLACYRSLQHSLPDIFFVDCMYSKLLKRLHSHDGSRLPATIIRAYKPSDICTVHVEWDHQEKWRRLGWAFISSHEDENTFVYEQKTGSCCWCCTVTSGERALITACNSSNLKCLGQVTRFLRSSKGKTCFALGSKAHPNIDLTPFQKK